jgi:voltage-gated potassium channel
MEASAEFKSQGDRGGPIAVALARAGVRRFSAVEFLVVLVLWILSASFVLQIPYGDLIEALLMTAVLASAVLAVGGRRRILAAAIMLGTPILICKWLNHLRPDVMPRQVHAAGLVVFMAFIAGHHLRFVLRAPRVNAEVLCAGISIYLMMGVLWAGAYMLVADSNPGAFAFTLAPDSRPSMAAFQALYFSLCTLGGFAYGDIIPATTGARMLATTEATVSMFYVTILIARLVSLYSSEGRTRDHGQ